MFGKGSRYRNLPESSALTADGERLRGKEMRVISRLEGRFQHTVRDGDRLDLLAFKYYGDPGRWWQIADANPEFQFPTDMLDEAPVVRERLALKHQDYFDRFDDLRGALEDIGQVRVGESSSFDGVSEPRDPDFLESTMVVTYDGSPASRHQIVTEINSRFDFLRSFAWTQNGDTIEAFAFDDQGVKEQWQVMTSTLASTPGILELRSAITEATLEIAYHGGRVSRQQILEVIAGSGFSVQADRSAVLLRAGSRIIVPPSQLT